MWFILFVFNARQIDLIVTNANSGPVRFTRSSAPSSQMTQISTPVPLSMADAVNHIRSSGVTARSVRETYALLVYLAASSAAAQSQYDADLAALQVAVIKVDVGTELDSDVRTRQAEMAESHCKLVKAKDTQAKGMLDFEELLDTPVGTRYILIDEIEFALFKERIGDNGRGANSPTNSVYRAGLSDARQGLETRIRKLQIDIHTTEEDFSTANTVLKAALTKYESVSAQIKFGKAAPYEQAIAFAALIKAKEGIAKAKYEHYRAILLWTELTGTGA